MKESKYNKEIPQTTNLELIQEIKKLAERTGNISQTQLNTLQNESEPYIGPGTSVNNQAPVDINELQELLDLVDQLNLRCLQLSHSQHTQLGGEISDNETDIGQ